MSNTMMGLKEFFNIHQKLAPGELIVDVRRQEEYADGHIPGSRNIPLDQIPTKADELKTADKVYLHCKKGGRARMAWDALSAAGLTNLVCIHDAGMDLWIESGYPVER